MPPKTKTDKEKDNPNKKDAAGKGSKAAAKSKTEKVTSKNAQTLERGKTDRGKEVINKGDKSNKGKEAAKVDNKEKAKGTAKGGTQEARKPKELGKSPSKSVGVINKGDKSNKGKEAAKVNNQEKAKGTAKGGTQEARKPKELAGKSPSKSVTDKGKTKESINPKSPTKSATDKGGKKTAATPAQSSKFDLKSIPSLPSLKTVKSKASPSPSRVLSVPLPILVRPPSASLYSSFIYIQERKRAVCFLELMRHIVGTDPRYALSLYTQEYIMQQFVATSKPWEVYIPPIFKKSCLSAVCFVISMQSEIAIKAVCCLELLNNITRHYSRVGDQGRQRSASSNRVED
jgi:hypothetical protein